jgi:hypothetical protein
MSHQRAPSTSGGSSERTESGLDQRLWARIRNHLHSWSEQYVSMRVTARTGHQE